MVKLAVVQTANADLVRSQPLVAVFVGGTSGIGEYTLRALAATTSASAGKGLRAYLVGRNAKAAENILTDCRRECPSGEFRFVQAKDLALLSDVDRICAEIGRLEKQEKDANGAGDARVDILVMTPGFVDLKGVRVETEEGLDASMSLLYYSRMRFIIQLLPLLQASRLPAAQVISVYAAGYEASFFPEDLSLRDPAHYSFITCRSHVVHMKTLFMESLAERHAGRLSLSHIFPSMVITPGYDLPHMPWWFKVIWALMKPFAQLVAVPARESGERTLFLASERFPARAAASQVKEAAVVSTRDSMEVAVATNGRRGGGAYAVNWNGEIIPVEKAYRKVRKEALTQEVWEHTMAAFREIEAGNVFKA